MEMENIKFTENKIIMDRGWFIWNAFGKDSIDTSNILTDEEWREFIAQCNDESICLEIEDWHLSEFEKYCKRIGKEVKV